MARILRERIDEACKGHEYLTEVVVAWTEDTPFGPVWCRAMLDVLCLPLGLVLDPKALRVAAIAGAFGKTAAESGYDLQARFYPRGVEAVVPELAGRVKFANLVVENYAPFAAATFEPDAETKAGADFQIHLAINRFAECLYSRKWPSYPKAPQTYSTPAWRQQQLIARQFSYENSEDDDGSRVQGFAGGQGRGPAVDWSGRAAGIRENLFGPKAGDGDPRPPWRPYRDPRHRAQPGEEVRATRWHQGR
jgi:hypothetical protein